MAKKPRSRLSSALVQRSDRVLRSRFLPSGSQTPALAQQEVPGHTSTNQGVHAPLKRSDRVLRFRVHTPVITQPEAAANPAITHGVHPETFDSAQRSEGALCPAMKHVREIKLEQDSTHVFSLREIPSQPTASQDQPRRRSLRSRSHTPTVVSEMPQGLQPVSTRLATITEQVTLNGGTRTKPSSLKRKLGDTAVPSTERTAGDVTRGADRAIKDAKSQSNTASQPPRDARHEPTSARATTTREIIWGVSACIPSNDVGEPQDIHNTPAGTQTLTQKTADASSAHNPLKKETTSNPGRSTTTSAGLGRTSTPVPLPSDTTAAEATDAQSHSMTDARELAPRETPRCAPEGTDVHYLSRKGLPTASPRVELFPARKAASGDGPTDTTDSHIPILATVPASPDIASRRETISGGRVTRSKKRAQSPVASMPPRKKRLGKPATTGALGGPKSTADALLEPMHVIKATARSVQAKATPKPKQPTPNPPPPAPYKKSDPPTLMRLEPNGLTGEMQLRYYKPRAEEKLEPPRMFRMEEDYYPEIRRPSFADMVARQEKMFSEVKWDTPEITHPYDGPKGIMAELTGHETEEEVIAYFDRVEMEGPNLSYAPMRMMRRRVEPTKPHICEWCAGELKEARQPEHWCECEEYCADPVGEYEAAMEEPVKERKQKPRAKKRWW